MVEIHERVTGPQLLTKFISSDYLTRVFEQHGQNLKRLVLQPNSVALLAQFTRTEINLVWPKPGEPNGAGCDLHWSFPE
jgi:hypothetical protein